MTLNSSVALPIKPMQVYYQVDDYGRMCYRPPQVFIIYRGVDFTELITNNAENVGWRFL